MIQCPEFAMIPPSTLVPTSRMIAGLLGSERFLGAQRQNRHGQLAFARERLVVGCVLRKGGKLIERGVHGARAARRFWRNAGALLRRSLWDSPTVRSRTGRDKCARGLSPAGRHPDRGN
jgi:hypothetical protein